MPPPTCSSPDPVGWSGDTVRRPPVPGTSSLSWRWNAGDWATAMAAWASCTHQRQHKADQGWCRSVSAGRAAHRCLPCMFWTTTFVCRGCAGGCEGCQPAGNGPPLSVQRVCGGCVEQMVGLPRGCRYQRTARCDGRGAPIHPLRIHIHTSCKRRNSSDLEPERLHFGHFRQLHVRTIRIHVHVQLTAAV